MQQEPSILIVAPVSVVSHWQECLKKWCPSAKQILFTSGSNRHELRYSLDNILARSGIVITTYGMITSNPKNFAPNNGPTLSVFGSQKPSYGWDFVFLDEGHKIKNPDTKLSKAIRTVPTLHRIILTGTPVQNTLTELWSLFDFCCPFLLGDRNTFEKEYAKVIATGSEKNACKYNKQRAVEAAKQLRKTISKYLLRREKRSGSIKKSNLTQLEAFKGGAGNNDHSNSSIVISSEHNDVNGNSESENQQQSLVQTQQRQKKISVPCLNGVKKYEVTVWIRLTEEQIKKYHDVLETPEIKSVLNKSGCALSAITLLKKICNHVKLLEKNPILFHPKVKSSQKFNSTKEFFRSFSQKLTTLDVENLCKESGKLTILYELLQSHYDNGHRTVVFSQSKKLLDIVQKMLESFSWRFLRLDGDIGKPQERQRRIKKFNEDSSYFCFIVTTQTGGVGITLTGADRAILFDPAWNPAVDTQAVDRIFRIGQRRDVLIYRFITCATIEERMYRKQVFKKGLFRSATSNRTNYRYFTGDELREVFSLNNPHESKTMKLFLDTHGQAPMNVENNSISKHLQKLQNHNLVAGITYHDILFSKEGEAPTPSPSKRKLTQKRRKRSLLETNCSQGKK